MSIPVNPGWWRTLFDEVYLLTDARSVCDDEITRREIDMICKLIPVREDDRILDLCGGHGRHSFELCSRGFEECTLVDYSPFLVEHALKYAVRCSYPVDVIRSDARNLGFPSESFDHVLILGNSLGYIQMPSADYQILSEAYRVLRPGGWLLVDVADGRAVKGFFAPNAWHEIGSDTVVCRQRELHGDTLRAREMVLSRRNGLVRDETYVIRLYEPEALETLFRRVGFDPVDVLTEFSPHLSEGDYGFMNRRMIATGQK
jgi:D-alanine-D-alanine ligase